MPIKEFLAAKKGMPWMYRIKVIEQDQATQWSGYLVAPKEGFIESYTGPIELRNIEYIEVNPFELRYMGRFEVDKRFDHSKEIVALLDSKEVPYSIVDQYVRVVLN